MKIPQNSTNSCRKQNDTFRCKSRHTRYFLFDCQDRLQVFIIREATAMWCFNIHHRERLLTQICAVLVNVQIRHYWEWGGLGRESATASTVAVFCPWAGTGTALKDNQESGCRSVRRCHSRLVWRKSKRKGSSRRHAAFKSREHGATQSTSACCRVRWKALFDFSIPKK